MYRHTAAAYKRAYQALGIDLINRVPLKNAPEPTPEGQTRPHPTKPYNYAALDDYIFPHYPEIWNEAKRLGKKIIFAADGDMTAFLPKLIELGVDGVFLESPATPLKAQIECFGERGRFFVGGIESATLTFGTPEEIRHMVLALHRRVEHCPGFGIRCCGPLAGNMPLQNLEANFDARAEIGATPIDWRICCRAS